MTPSRKDANFTSLNAENVSISSSLKVQGTLHASQFTNNNGLLETPIGTVIQSILTPKQMKSLGQGYVLADGRLVIGTPYHLYTKRKRVPNLMGMFTRGSTDPEKIGKRMPSSTAIPNNGFVTTENGEHSHLVFTGESEIRENQEYIFVSKTAPPGADYAKIGVGRSQFSTQNNPLGVAREAGSHAHFIKGGDVETAPVHFILNYYVFVGMRSCKSLRKILKKNCKTKQ